MRRNSLRQKIKSFLSSPFLRRGGHHQPDYLFIGSLGLIIVFGLIMLSSASSVEAYQKFQDSYHFFKHQLLNGVIPGIIGFIIASRLDYKTWRKYAFAMLLVSLGLLVLVFLPGIGQSFGKTQSWVKIGFISFQPVEIVKLTFLIYLASWLEKRGEHLLADVKSGLLPFLTSLGIVSLLIMAQPDFGSLIIILATCFIVYFIAGAPIKHIAWIFSGALMVMFLAVLVAPYRLDRITTFLHPENDPQGIGYQTSQARLGIGSGGILGLGIGNSREKFAYLPEVYGDSIFAIIGEEMGFIFSTMLLALYLTLILRGLKIANRAPDDFGKFLAVGIASWFTFQAFVNISAMIGLFPLTGIPLPFISYGGTAMAINLFAAGIVVNISKQTS